MVQKRDPELLIAMDLRLLLMLNQQILGGGENSHTYLPSLARNERSHYERTLLLRVESFQLGLITFDREAQLR
jgi:hypothetical protein